MPLIRKHPSRSTASPSGPADHLAALRTGSPDQRWSAARALGPSIGDIDALGAALAEEDDPRVAGAIFTSLIRCNSPDAAAAVAPYLRSDEVRLRTGALDALRAMPVAAERQIEILLDDCDPDVRLLTCEVLRGLPGEQATSLACALLDRETEPNVCGAIIDVLAEVGVADALPALARCGERFADEPFLVFSVRTAIGRIHAQPDRTRDSELGG